jgi:hypothetical protein
VSEGEGYRAVDTIDWLLNSDPAIRWQPMRDLTDASPEAASAERARVTREGVGAEILAIHAALSRQSSRGSSPVVPAILFKYF